MNIYHINFHSTDPRTAGSFYLNMMQQRKEMMEYPVIVIGSTHSPNQLATDVREAFLHEIHIEVAFIILYLKHYSRASLIRIIHLPGHLFGNHL